jgi:short-subunit dehydrogenase
MRPPIDSGTVLITGACSGIGREIARQLAHRARTLVLVAQAEQQLATLKAELETSNPTLGVILMPCDISRPGEVGDMLAELARHFIRVDVLVNAITVGERDLFARLRWGSVERMLLANVVAPLLLTRRLLGPMLAQGRGGILQISSGASQLFLPGAAAYVATLRCLDGFIESLRLEVEGTGVVITQAAPGPVDDMRPATGPPLGDDTASPAPARGAAGAGPVGGQGAPRALQAGTCADRQPQPASGGGALTGVGRAEKQKAAAWEGCRLARGQSGGINPVLRANPLREPERRGIVGIPWN